MESLGYSDDDIQAAFDCGSLLGTGCIARVTEIKQDRFPSFYVEGAEDKVAESVNRYKLKPPADHNKLSLIKMPYGLVAIADMPTELENYRTILDKIKNDPVVRYVHTVDHPGHVIEFHTSGGAHDNGNVEMARRWLTNSAKRTESIDLNKLQDMFKPVFPFNSRNYLINELLSNSQIVTKLGGMQK